MRPVLSPGARRLWRDQQTLQLGRLPDRAPVLSGLDESARAVLSLLDGTRDVGRVLADAPAAGCSPVRAAELMGLLDTAGLLADADERWPAGVEGVERDRLSADAASLALLHGRGGLTRLRQRDAASVVVVGAGRVGAPLAALLAASGVGTVDVVDDGRAAPADAAVGGLRACDAGRRRGEAARERLLEVAPRVRSGPVGRPDVVTLAPASGVEEDSLRALLDTGVPHLLAEVRDTTGVVGPFVLPGRSACLTCLDHARTDADPDWPVLALQLAAPCRAPAPCDVVLAAAVAAQAAMQVLALLDGGCPPSLDGSLELALPDWRWRRRSWQQHPACECRALRAG